MHQSRVLSLAGLVPLYADFERRMIRLVPNATIAKGTVMAEQNGVFFPYSGSQPKCILEYDCKTDGAGRAWYYIAIGMDVRPLDKASAFFKGAFRCQELVGLDQNAVIVLGRLLEGDYLNGILRVC